VHHEFAPEGKNFNAVFYVVVLKRLKDRVRCMDRNCGREAMDSPPRECPTHSALIVREFLARNFITVLEHPPYSPDLAPCDFLLFPKCCGGGIWGM